MKCPQCHAEIPDFNHRCPYCGCIPATIQASAAPATASGASPYFYTANSTATHPMTKKGKSGGEIAAIITAIIVSVLSVIASFIIFSIYTMRLAQQITPYDLDGLSSDFYSDFGDYGDYDDYGDFGNFGDFGGYGMDGLDDEDSWESFFEHYSSLFGQTSKYPASSPAAEHQPISFDNYLYSFSNGNINTTYSVELDEAYRGAAALKLLEGAKLPEMTDTQEIYLAKFKLTVTEQETEAFVTVGPSSNTTAYAWTEDGTSGKQYFSLGNISYKDNNKLIKKGEETDCWMAFVIDKTEERPLIMWDKYQTEYFRYSKEAISSETGLTAGAAIEPETDTDTSSR